MAGVPAPLSATCLTTCRALRRRSDTTLLDVISDITACEKQCQSAPGKTHTQNGNHQSSESIIRDRWMAQSGRKSKARQGDSDERGKNRTSEACDTIRMGRKKTGEGVSPKSVPNDTLERFRFRNKKIHL